MKTRNVVLSAGIALPLLALAGMWSARQRGDGVGYYTVGWSPDGSEIVFESNRDGNSAVYRMRIDGTDLRKLTDSTATNGQPRWSPDGRRIVFISDRDGWLQIYLMNADGTEQHRLAAADATEYSPDFSPAGDRVAFQSRSRGKGNAWHDIYVVDVDGSGRARVTDGQADYVGPQWSPDGSRILFARGTARHSTRELGVISPDGSSMRPLTQNDVRDYRGTWSSDGGTVYFLSDRDGPTHVYAMNEDGTAPRKVVDGDIVSSPGLSPDDRFFVYSKTVDGKSGIYIYEIATGTERLVIGG